ncbi:TIGR04283 family arsenosugar biosynthesis glycosyltransferase [Halioxenophilus aromaticivorans]|uniref:TIGR04283 family arsenosugar biosynthesis glycosyltransferase n=1 Tax=Halioxenophilus aromaticivorans TaxID=1306992 RepID=A0AAV3U0W8_9ALTE
MNCQRCSPSVSVIVPVFNECDNLPALLAHVKNLAALQVILVDGGSSDGSQQLLAESGLTWLSSRPGRARQMNAGASQATGDVLLFLHADTRLPEHSLALLGDGLDNSNRVWGRFNVSIAGASPWLKCIAFMMNQRSRLTGIATGDQAIFIQRLVFESLGGYADIALMEDVELSKRLKCYGPPVCIRQKVITSGRRWQKNGVVKTVLLMWWLRFAYWCGVSPVRLARWYS